MRISATGKAQYFHIHKKWTALEVPQLQYSNMKCHDLNILICCQLAILPEIFLVFKYFSRKDNSVVCHTLVALPDRVDFELGSILTSARHDTFVRPPLIKSFTNMSANYYTERETVPNTLLSYWSAVNIVYIL